MAEIIEVERKSNVLSHPTLPCLSAHYTINQMAGCPFECRYCYAQSFRSHPGQGKVLFYANTLDLLRRELPRKRKKPEQVYLSTACEPFAPFKRNLESIYEVMRLLLENSIFLLISTKSRIPERFLKLFAHYPDLIHVHLGMTTVDDRVRQLLEPYAAPVEDRLANIRDLAALRIRADVRADPLIPELTDTGESFARLCEKVADCGIGKMIASYLFLRGANYRRLAVTLGDWSFSEMSKRLYVHRIEEYCGGGTIRIPEPEYREKKYGELKSIAEDRGIHLSSCHCKNPDLTVERCHPGPPATRENPKQATLFPD